uniref:Uncharacterized protein n=1 Tax=Octopus bimaculoides TaxID=37653 RepID=A0A0L8GT28_OCTBM
MTSSEIAVMESVRSESPVDNVSGTECKDKDGRICTCCNTSCCPERRQHKTSFNMWYFW